jgi:hypothetical protein
MPSDALVIALALLVGLLLGHGDRRRHESEVGTLKRLPDRGSSRWDLIEARRLYFGIRRSQILFGVKRWPRPRRLFRR